ncbi:MAG: hypothetical protein Q4P78_09125, partial [Rothia sp. (in: high G+C Gram-positive bacteria)]|uniref:hypothetical protein n=1 Tax=Rothia sp. (in: high G+C Gram-positive bacteria) TaxID=1885016 RepID=UPI0026E0DC77
WLAVIERLGIDGITDLLNDPDKREAYAEANKKYVESVAKSKELEQEYEKNLAESLALIDKLQKERGLSDETIDAAVELVMRIANEALVGKFTSETIDMALKAVNHDADMANAEMEGETRGKNARIEEKLRKPVQGDGTPHLSGSHNAPTRKNTRASIFDIADEAR